MHAMQLLLLHVTHASSQAGSYKSLMSEMQLHLAVEFVFPSSLHLTQHDATAFNQPAMQNMPASIALHSLCCTFCSGFCLAPAFLLVAAGHNMTCPKHTTAALQTIGPGSCCSKHQHSMQAK
jgi:hypothetical protein